MHKKGSDRITKETFKTKKDLEDSTIPKKVDEAKPMKIVEEKPVVEKNETLVKERNSDVSKDLKVGQDVEQIKKKSELKLKDRERSSSLSATSNTLKEEIEKEAKVKSNEQATKTAAREEVKHRSKTRTEEALSQERKPREKPRDEKKASEPTENKAKAKEMPARSSIVTKGKEEVQSKAVKKAAEPSTSLPKPSQIKVPPPQEKVAHQERTAPLQEKVTPLEKITLLQEKVTPSQGKVTPQEKVTPPQEKVTPSQGKVIPSQGKVTPQDKVTPSQGKITPPQGKVTLQDKVTPSQGKITPPQEKITPPQEKVTPPQEKITPQEKPNPPQEKVTPPQEKVTPPSSDSVFDFKDEVEVLEPPKEKLKPPVIETPKERTKSTMVEPLKEKMKPVAVESPKEKLKPAVVELPKEKLRPNVVEPKKEKLKPVVVEPLKEKPKSSVEEPQKEKLKHAVVEPLKEKLNPVVIEPPKEKLKSAVVEPSKEKLKPTVVESPIEKLKPAVVESPKEKLKPTLVESAKEKLTPVLLEPLKEKLKPAVVEKQKLPKLAEKPAEAPPSDSTSQASEPTKPAGPDYASFAAQTKIEATSSSSPASEDDDAPLLIIADEPEDVDEVQEVDRDEDDIAVIEQTKTKEDGKEEKSAEDGRNAIKAVASCNAKQLKSTEPTEQEQLEKSIASITSDPRPDAQSDPLAEDSCTVVPTPVEQKRTVISQEETENAINALLGESFESFEEPVEPSVPRPVESLEVGGDDEAAAAVAGLAEDEAASAVLGLATEMSPGCGEEWHRAKQQEEENIENIAAEIRRSSTESASRRLSGESKDPAEDKPSVERSDKQPARISPTKISPPEESLEPEVEQILEPVLEEKPIVAIKLKPSPEEKQEPEKATRIGRKLFLGQQGTQEEQKVPHDVFDFKVEEEPLEPRKMIERPKQPTTSTVDTVIEEVVKSSYEERHLASPPVAARVGTPRERVKPQLSPVVAATVAVQQPIQVATSIASPATSTPCSPAMRTTESPLALQTRVSTDEKASPPLPLASPNSAKSPKPRMRRSTGGKSRESEEESPDTLQKINLILEQAKQEAERSAHLQSHLVSLPYSQPGPQDILIDPKTGQVVARQAAPNSVTLTLVTSSADYQHPSDMRVVPPRTGVPQPTVLPPRHEQQVRPGAVVPRAVAAPARPPRPPLPIQLPTQPLPPESVRKAQPVLLEQNQPKSQLATRQPLPVSLPTEPVPRSVVAASQLPALPRAPLPFSSSQLLVTTGAPVRLVTSQPAVARQVAVSQSWQGPHRGMHPLAETSQRVSLNKRDKEPELEQAKPQEQPQVPVKVQRDYLQPREVREVHRPASTPLQTQPSLVSNQPYEVPPTHLVTSAAQQQYQQEQEARNIDLMRLANYRDLTLIYNQLLTQGHPEHVARDLAQSMVRERYEYATAHREEPRPSSVPPGLAMHHMEEMMRAKQQQQQQIVQQRQPLPAHSSQVDPYRQADSPHAPLYLGTHPYSNHMDSYRRPGVGPEPPAAHSAQPLTRMTQSPAVSDYSVSRPASPAYNTSMSDYRLPHLAAYPICWSGTIGLKNDFANVRMHYVSGNRDLAQASLPDTGSTLKIVQRMRLEDSQLDGVARKMETKSEHCMLLALPNGSEHEEIEHQSKILRSNFITYLQLKSAAGIVNVSNEDNQPAYIVHVFPSCDFANENLAR